MPDIPDSFWRLVDAVVEGRALPFLGAGVSAQARCPGKPRWKPTVEYMRTALISGEALF